MKQMKKIFISGLFILLCTNVFAQKISAPTIDIKQGSNVDIVLDNEASDNAVALQLTLVLPKTFTVYETTISKGTSIRDHNLEWRRVSDNTYLFVFYNLNNTPLPDGELLRIPIKVCDIPNSYECEVRSIRSSNEESVGTDAESLAFNINVTDPDGISDAATEEQKGDGIIYDLQGRKIQDPQPAKHSIYIINGKKVLYK